MGTYRLWITTPAGGRRSWIENTTWESVGIRVAIRLISSFERMDSKSAGVRYAKP